MWHPRIRTNSLPQACVRKLSTVSWLPWLTSRYLSRQSNYRRRRLAQILEGCIYPCQADSSEDSMTSGFLPQSGLQKQPRCSPREKRGYPLAQKTEVKGSAGTSLGFKRKMAPRAGDICNRSHSGTEKGGSSQASLLLLPTFPPCSGPLPHSTSIISLGGGGWSQHPWPENGEDPGSSDYQ